MLYEDVRELPLGDNPDMVPTCFVLALLAAEKPLDIDLLIRVLGLIKDCRSTRMASVHRR